MSWGAGNDYSMILHAVEDNITDVIDISDSDDVDGGNDDVSSCDGNDNNSESIRSASANMKMELQLDDAKLKNEELKVKLRAQKDDFNREKDKYLRQLQFLESENQSIKKDLTVRTEKYFDTKKKLQSVVRAADSEKKKLQAHIAELASPVSIAPASRANQPLESNSSQQAAFNKRLTELEDNVLSKTAEIKELKVKNAQLEEHCSGLQQQVLLARCDAANQDDLSNLKDLQSKVKELEYTLRQTNREYNKLQKSAKNSHILEEDLSTCHAKVQSLQASVKNYRVMEVEFNTLVQEKKSWELHFRDLLSQSSDSSGHGDAKDFDKKTDMKGAAGAGAGADTADTAVTPVVVLRLLSNMQSTCAAALRDNGILENKISELSNAQRRAALSSQQAELDLAEQTAKARQLEHSVALLRQQAKLYEGEVMSLRSLLKTFDAEILIIGHKKKRSRTSMEGAVPRDDPADDSSADISALLNVKNQEVDDLRRELDEQRTAGAAVLKKLMADVEGLTATRRPTPEEEGALELCTGLKRDLKVAQDRCRALQEDMYWLQRAAGLDFIPGKTKVLHLKSNPSLQRFLAPGTELRFTAKQSALQGGDSSEAAPAYFLTPLHELRHLRALIRQGNLVSPGVIAVETNKRIRSDSAGATTQSSAGLDTSTSLNTTSTRANVSMSAGGVDSQKMNQRLKEAFREKIAEYREAVYLLFGYKVDLMSADSITGEPGSSLLKLRSMYAESSDDCLKFLQRKGKDGLEILETDFATSLDESIILALKASNSVPTFLSEITLDLFGKQTFLG